MALTKFGVIVWTNSAIIVGYVYPSHDNTELDSFQINAGQQLIQVTNGPFPSSAAWAAAVSNAVQNATGKPPGDARCCVIDGNGNVVNVIQADGAGCAAMFPGMTLVNSTVGGIGWTWSAGGGFVPPPAGTRVHG